MSINCTTILHYGTHPAVITFFNVLICGLSIGGSPWMWVHQLACQPSTQTVRLLPYYRTSYLLPQPQLPVLSMAADTNIKSLLLGNYYRNWYYHNEHRFARCVFAKQRRVPGFLHLSIVKDSAASPISRMRVVSVCTLRVLISILPAWTGLEGGRLGRWVPSSAHWGCFDWPNTIHGGAV